MNKNGAISPRCLKSKQCFRVTVRSFACVIALLSAHTAYAQEAPNPAPLSAIDWLSDSLTTPRRAPSIVPIQPQAPKATPSTTRDLSTNALPQTVTVVALNAPRIDAVGLLSSAQTGLPSDLWGASNSLDLSRRITSIAAKSDLLPASRRLLNTLLLAELAPPAGLEHQGRLFLARIDALLAQGLLDEADALMQRAGVENPEIFRRSFDTKLLLGTEDEACAQLRRTRGLSPALPTRIFCLARDGDWDTAALTLESADALGLISKDESLLLARFLEPSFDDDQGSSALSLPSQPSPLTFRLLEAIGEPQSTRTLPLAFAQSDLRSSTGWKVRASAAERLARVGAISPNRWLGIWSEHLPAASGGIWDRMEALQRFETALNTGDPGAISRGLDRVWTEMGNSGLQPLFATLFADRLVDIPLSDEAAALAREISLLSPSYEVHAANWSEEVTQDPVSQSRDAARMTFLRAIALGDTPTQRPTALKDRAIYDGLRAEGIPVRMADLVASKRLGEAILRAIELLEGGAAGDLDELTDAIQFFRAAGLEATARRATLEILLLERRG